MRPQPPAKITDKNEKLIIDIFAKALILVYFNSRDFFLMQKSKKKYSVAHAEAFESNVNLSAPFTIHNTTNCHTRFNSQFHSKLTSSRTIASSLLYTLRYLHFYEMSRLHATERLIGDGSLNVRAHTGEIPALIKKN